MKDKKKCDTQDVAEDVEEKSAKIKKKRKRRTRRLIAVFLCVAIVGASVPFVLQAGVAWADKNWKQWYPDYDKQDITELIDRGIADPSTLTQEDYALIYAQTGLTKLGVNGLLEEKNKRRILAIQDFYCQPREVFCDKFNPYSYSETVGDFAPFAALKDGDIIVSATTHVSMWRIGHSCLVVDGKNERILEGIVSDSRIASADVFANLADFMVLRPTADEETRAAVAKYARERLTGIPYDVSVGILSPKNPKELKRTQCSHLIWYAYKQFGVDLDSNGGLVVSPREMANSPLVEVVQIFGFPPQTLWR